MLIDLNLVKVHVRADEFADDDEYLKHLTETAEEFVVGMTNRSLEELYAMSVDGALPKPLVQAVLLCVGHWYNQRESVAAVNMTEVPYTVQALVKPYRKLVD